MTATATDAVTLTLPWPPSVNHYWRTWQGRHLVSRAGRAYRGAVALAVIAHRDGPPRLPLAGRLALTLTAHPPDRRVRDIDNLLKGTLDSLAHAGVYGDDGSIDDLRIVRSGVVAGGRLEVQVRVIAPAE